MFLLGSLALVAAAILGLVTGRKPVGPTTPDRAALGGLCLLGSCWIPWGRGAAVANVDRPVAPALCGPGALSDSAQVPYWRGDSRIGRRIWSSCHGHWTPESGESSMSFSTVPVWSGPGGGNGVWGAQPDGVAAGRFGRPLVRCWYHPLVEGTRGRAYRILKTRLALAGLIVLTLTSRGLAGLELPMRAPTGR